MNDSWSQAPRVVGSVLLVLLGALAAAGCGAEAPGDEPVAKSEGAAVTNVSGWFYDGLTAPATQCTVNGTRMHCCPTGNAMIGARLDYNVFKCAPLKDPGGTVSYSTLVRNGTVACPFGQVMVGYHETLQAAACQTLPHFPVITEYADPGQFPAGSSPTEDSFPMHICNPDAFSGYVMTGISSAANKFLCGKDFATL